ncbi:chromosome-partitioning ATPase Soj [bacterium BMS3Bbin11]|nr:chromosome-partitioning ATPase Soj [bacterium BMS3Abin11]GBE45169.1 chromosome-partitioning ATPase Soj [bacterium BMS3Bbin11]GMT39481.1 MAG: cobyrinic acid a,c-diamide synthase [bacterium]HDH08613.1 ParA family protein [Gammaproteobacteria bacterium]HDH16959.1 ParA family protein [Gammaproteobacteria bacterium]
MITLVGNFKGGTGKSTVAFNLAIWLAIQGKKTAVVDLDPQGSLTDVMYVREEMDYSPLLPVFQELNKKMIKDWDELIVDVGTADLPAMEKALTIAGRVIIPVAPSQPDVWSTQRFMDLVRKNCKKDTIVTGLINRADTHPKVKETEETMEALSMINGLKMQKCYLYQRTAYRRAFSEGLTVFEMMPANKAAGEVWRLSRSLFKTGKVKKKKKNLPGAGNNKAS